jgi:hypothetical protein
VSAAALKPQRSFEMKNRFSVLVHCWYLVLFCLAWSSCSKLSQWFVKTPNQENIFELLNGIRDKAEVGDRILEYELYDVPGNESYDFVTFIRSYTKTLNEYIFNLSSKHWIEDNTEWRIA